MATDRYQEGFSDGWDAAFKEFHRILENAEVKIAVAELDKELPEVLKDGLNGQ